MWNPAAKDGWNGEDFNIYLPATGQLRPNFRPRPHPVAVAGVPIRFGFVPGDVNGRGASCEFSWDHHPDRGETEVFVPTCRFPAGRSIATNNPRATWTVDEVRQRIRVQCPVPGVLTLAVGP